MVEHIKYKLKLTDAQLRKLAKGKGCQLKPDQIGEGFDICMCNKKMKKMMSARRRGKGVRFSMSPEEMQLNTQVEGGRISFHHIGKTFKHGVKAASKFYKEKIKPAVGPSLKKAVKQGIEVGIPALVESAAALVGQPELGMAALPYAERLAHKISEPISTKLGRLTGAYGLKHGKGPYTYDDWDTFVKPSTQAFHPTLPLPDFSHRVPYQYVSGRGLKESEGGQETEQYRGFPWNPLLPLKDMSEPHYIGHRHSMEYLPPNSVHTGSNSHVITLTGKHQYLTHKGHGVGRRRRHKKRKEDTDSESEEEEKMRRGYGLGYEAYQL